MFCAGTALAYHWTELTPVDDGMAEVGPGGCCVAGRGFIFVAVGDDGDGAYAYEIAGDSWHDISGTNGDIVDAGAIAFDSRTERRLFLACDNDTCPGSESLYIYRIFADTNGIAGDWKQTALDLPAQMGRGVGMAFALGPTSDLVLAGFVYLLRGDSTRNFYRRRFDRSDLIPIVAGPLDGAHTKADTMFLDWQPNTPGAQYEFQVGLASCFLNPAVHETTDCGEYIVPSGILQPGQTYYWRVRALEDGRAFGWSDVEDFQTTAASAAGGYCTFPPDEAEVSGDEPVFDWPAVVGAVEYELLARSQPGDTVINETLAVSEYSHDEPLETGNYVWKTRSRNARGAWTGWGTEYSLAVDHGWTERASIPSDRAVYEGGALCFGEDEANDPCLWAFPGNCSREFWRYNPELDSWFACETTWRAQTGGAALVSKSSGNTVVALTGGLSDYHYNYGVSSGHWTCDSVTLPRICGYGSGLAFSGRPHLVIAELDERNFYRYDPNEEDGEQTQHMTASRGDAPAADIVLCADGMRIRYSLASPGHVRISVLDLCGRVVVALASCRQTSGTHELMWNCADRTGSRVASGVYIVRLETPAGSQALKTVLER